MTETSERASVTAVNGTTTTAARPSNTGGLSDVPPTVPLADTDLKLRLLLPHVGVAFVILSLLVVDFLLFRRRNRLQLDAMQEKQEMMDLFPKRAFAGVYRNHTSSPYRAGLATRPEVTVAAARGRPAEQNADAAIGVAKQSSDAAKSTAVQSTDAAKGTAKHSTDARKGTAKQSTDAAKGAAKQSTDAAKGTAGIPCAASGSAEQSTDTSPDSGNGSPPENGENGKPLRKKQQKKLVKRLKNSFLSSVAPSESAESAEDRDKKGSGDEGCAPGSLRRLQRRESWLRLPPIHNDQDHRSQMHLYTAIARLQSAGCKRLAAGDTRPANGVVQKEETKLPPLTDEAESRGDLSLV